MISDKAIFVKVEFFEICVIIIIIIGARMSPLGTVATTGILYEPQMTDDGDCGAIHGINFGRTNRSTLRKPVAAPLYLPQNPHDHPGLNPGRRGAKSMIITLSYGAASLKNFTHVVFSSEESTGHVKWILPLIDIRLLYRMS
jgi:hypothetical protein